MGPSRSAISKCIISAWRGARSRGGWSTWAHTHKADFQIQQWKSNFRGEIRCADWNPLSWAKCSKPWHVTEVKGTWRSVKTCGECAFHAIIIIVMHVSGIYARLKRWCACYAIMWDKGIKICKNTSAKNRTWIATIISQRFSPLCFGAICWKIW